MEDTVLDKGDLLVGEDELLPLRIVVGGEFSIEQLQHTSCVADDVVVGLDVLVDLGPVDVDIYDLGLAGKGGRIVGHPVGKPAADGDEQVALAGGDVGRMGAVLPIMPVRGVVAGTAPPP